MPIPAFLLRNGYSKSSVVASAVAAARSALLFTIPSVFTASPTKPTPSRVLDPVIAAQRASTDCLDGLRGVAAFAVMIFHFSVNSYPNIREAYGYKGNANILQLPFIKIWYSGGFMVFLFFVISGYVLSARIVRLMVRRERDRILPVLCSMTFRRVVRLGLPSLAAALLSFLCQRLGLLGQPRKDYEPGLATDAAFFLRTMRDLFTFYDWRANHIWHLPPLWTIAVEFRCSMVLFLVLLGIARCRSAIRLAIESLLLIDCLLHDRWDMACFLLGLLAAEVHVHSQESAANHNKEAGLLHNLDADDSPTSHAGSPRSSRHRRLLATAALWTAFVAGMYLGSVPTAGACETPGYVTLCALTRSFSEPWRYIMLPGSFLIVFAILFLPPLQRPLAAAPARYLGRVSYALYLVHELVNMVAGAGIRRMGWAVLGREGWLYHAGFALGLVVYVMLCLWLADMFMRAVDAPAVRVARWLEEVSVDKEPAADAYGN